MENKSNYREIYNKLAELGVVEYQYLYEKGKIRWRDKNQKVVAFASCKAIMSFASTNNSYNWGLFPNTPTLEKPEWVEDMKFDVTDAETREVAVKAALESGSDFMFAGNWMTLTVYLACNDLVFSDDQIKDESVPWHPVEGDMNKYAEMIHSIIDNITE